ncbi:hypothetical protein [Taklimakanibacter deserti]|uniref:hypothetical protein n=1 Tax=Taklimakanibacter deserti TaxID=2267839 RepID=UPI000E656683
MTLKPDLVVCNPNASSERGKAVFFHFEIVNPATLENTGVSHNIAMPHADAKKLFDILGEMSKQYGWLDTAPEVLRVSPEGPGPAAP